MFRVNVDHHIDFFSLSLSGECSLLGVFFVIGKETPTTSTIYYYLVYINIYKYIYMWKECTDARMRVWREFFIKCRTRMEIRFA